jgi:Spy/CpxP family protein refolding chaperone
MKKIHAVVAGVCAGVALAVAAVAYAQPFAGMGQGFGPGMGMGMGPGHGPMAGQQLMTPEERAAFQEKMRSAKTPEERQKLAEATRTEMQKRANDRGITLPEHRAPGAGFGPGSMTHSE